MKNQYLASLLLVLVGSQSFLCSRVVAPAGGLIPRISYDVQVLAHDSLEGRATGSVGEEKAGKYVSGRMSDLGLVPKGEADTWFQSFSFKPHPPVQRHQSGDSVTMGMALVQEVTGRNVIGFLDLGATRTVIIGAHYDHLGMGDENSLWPGERKIHNGADDNASGVACMLEIARRIRLNPDAYNRNNFMFIAFSGEEKGLWGSNYFTKNPTVDSSTFNYMINLDMVGRLNSMRTIAINGTGTSPIWNEEIPQVRAGKLAVVSSEDGIGPSDHTSFYHIGVPAIHFFTGQHEDYHKPTDVANRINYAGITAVADFITELIGMLNTRGALTFTKTRDERKSDTPDFKVTLGVIPDYLFGGPGMRIDGTREGRPAQVSGLRQGDVIIRIGEYPVTDMMSYMECLSRFGKGESTEVEVIREGRNEVFFVTWD